MFATLYSVFVLWSRSFLWDNLEWSLFVQRSLRRRPCSCCPLASQHQPVPVCQQEWESAICLTSALNLETTYSHNRDIPTKTTGLSNVPRLLCVSVHTEQKMAQIQCQWSKVERNVAALPEKLVQYVFLYSFKLNLMFMKNTKLNFHRKINI